MFTDEATFLKIVSSSKTAIIDESAVRIPSLDHLLALKVHALKHTNVRRFLKGFDDVCSLIKANKIDVHGAEFRELVDKFGNRELYEKIVRLSQL